MGSPAILRFFFHKTAFSYRNTYKTGMLFGQHFEGELPRNLNDVFLRQFGNGFNKKTGMFMFKNQNDGARPFPRWILPTRHVAIDDDCSGKGLAFTKNI